MINARLDTNQYQIENVDIDRFNRSVGWQRPCSIHGSEHTAATCYIGIKATLSKARGETLNIFLKRFEHIMINQ